MPTVQDVARRAGVGAATVSRVMNAHPHVRPEVRERVLQAIRELNYVPNRAARDLRTGTTRTIGFIVSDIRNPFYAEISRGIEDVAYSRGYAVLLANSDFRPEKEKLYLETLRAEQAAGVIISPNRRRSAAYNAFLEAGLPVVAIDRPLQAAQTDAVLLDNRAGVKMALEHLLALGHQRIAVLGAHPNLFSTSERVAAFRQTMVAHGMEIDERLIETCTPGDLARTAARLLAERPGAVLATSNLASRAVLRASADAGVHMPGDLALAGFDDAEWAELISVPLTVVAQPTYEIGAQAARLIFQRIDGGAGLPRREVRLQPELRVRQSTDGTRVGASP